jgi:hypothetical protein
MTRRELTKLIATGAPLSGTVALAASITLTLQELPLKVKPLGDDVVHTQTTVRLDKLSVELASAGGCISLAAPKCCFVLPVPEEPVLLHEGDEIYCDVVTIGVGEGGWSDKMAVGFQVHRTDGTDEEYGPGTRFRRAL